MTSELSNGLLLRVGSRESAAQKARRLLAEGRLLIRRVHGGEIDSLVRGDTAVHRVTFRYGDWSCTCASKGDCSHIRATRLVCWIGDADAG